MKSCQLITSGLNVAPLLSRLGQNPQLWGEINYRKEPQGEHLSPHRESFDIHLRYNPIGNSGKEDYHTAPHIPEWYPVVSFLPEVVPLVGSTLSSVCSEMLGSVFLINVPKGCQIYPHVDKSWNSTYFKKFCVGIQNKENKGVCKFEDGSEFSAEDGAVWEFENNIVHWFDNTQGVDDCLMMIVNCRPIVTGVMRDVFGGEVKDAA